MPARRIIAVTPDTGLGQRITTAIAGLGVSLELFRDVGSVPPGDVEGTVWVLHLDHEPVVPPEALARIGGRPVVVVLPRPPLAAIVSVMEAVPQVAAVVAAEDADQGQLQAILGRVLGGDGFGLAKLLAPGTQVHSIAVGDFEAKQQCMSQIATLVEQLGIPTTRAASIEQALDEMLMNALYDAPVDAKGKHVFKGVPTSTRITMRTGHEVVVEYAWDGARFAIAVRDAFGSLARSTVVAYLHKGLHAENKIDRKAGGAGLGLFLMANAATAVYFNVAPDVASEAVCIFSLAGKQALAQFGFFVQLDPHGRPRATPARKRLAGPAARRQRNRRLAVAAAVAVLGTTAAIALPRILAAPPASEVTFTSVPPGATIEIDGRAAGVAGGDGLVLRDLKVEQSYAVTARLDDYEPATKTIAPPDGRSTVVLELQALPIVELDTRPTDASVEIDGTPMGSTPLKLTTFTAGAKLSLVFTKSGYRPAKATLTVPGRGEREELVQPLEVDERLVRVRLVSTPPGAVVITDGKPPGVDRTYTPAEVFVEAGTPQHFMLTMPRHVPAVIEPFVVEPGQQGIEKSGTLAEGVALRISSARAGTASVVGAPHCQRITVPFECTLVPGTYTVELVPANGAKITRETTLSTDQPLAFD